MKKMTTQELTLSGVLAALYVVITLATTSFAFGPIQFRLADALCVLPFFVPSTAVGLSLGCLIANIFSTVSAVDIVVGSAATLLGCLGAAHLKNRWLVPLPTILSNTVLVGAMLAFFLTPEAPLAGFFTYAARVGLGEIAVMAVLGLPLIALFHKTDLLEQLLKRPVRRG